MTEEIETKSLVISSNSQSRFDYQLKLNQRMETLENDAFSQSEHTYNPKHEFGSQI